MADSSASRRPSFSARESSHDRCSETPSSSRIASAKSRFDGNWMPSSSVIPFENRGEEAEEQNDDADREPQDRVLLAQAAGEQHPEDDAEHEEREGRPPGRRSLGHRSG